MSTNLSNQPTQASQSSTTLSNSTILLSDIILSQCLDNFQLTNQNHLNSSSNLSNGQFLPSINAISQSNQNTVSSNTALPISGMGNILQLHCNPNLTLQVNNNSSVLPVSTKENNNIDTQNLQINNLRSIFPSISQTAYQNSTQNEQSSNYIINTNTSTNHKSFAQLIQDLTNTYQTQQDGLQQLTCKYNFLLNAMERLLFDVQNSVEYSLLALGISQTIAKVKLGSFLPNGAVQPTFTCAPLFASNININNNNINNASNHNNTNKTLPNGIIPLLPPNITQQLFSNIATSLQSNSSSMMTNNNSNNTSTNNTSNCIDLTNQIITQDNQIILANLAPLAPNSTGLTLTNHNNTNNILNCNQSQNLLMASYNPNTIKQLNSINTNINNFMNASYTTAPSIMTPVLATTSPVTTTINCDSNISAASKMTSLDKLDKLIDETVKKSTNTIKSNGENTELKLIQPQSQQLHLTQQITTLKNVNTKPNELENISSITNQNMSSAIQQIIRQFYQNNSATVNVIENHKNLAEDDALSNDNEVDDDDDDAAEDDEGDDEMDDNPNNNNASHKKESNLVNAELLGQLATNSTNINDAVNSSDSVCYLTGINNIVTDDLTKSNITNPNNNASSSCNSNQDDLDPTEVATKIRDILSLHSIGQRLFAKHVLNLSQGTVSELLSKPKSWNKLSEKGRDSYRKMHQWSLDSSRVQELKSIAPRKGFSGHYTGMSPATPIKEDHETQEKIKRILNDAKMAMASNSTTQNSTSNINEEILTNYTNNIVKSCCSSTNLFPSISASSTNTSILKFTPNVSTLKPINTNNPTLNIVNSSNISSSASSSTPLIVMNFANLVSGTNNPSINKATPIIPFHNSTALVSSNNLPGSTTSNLMVSSHALDNTLSTSLPSQSNCSNFINIEAFSSPNQLNTVNKPIICSKDNSNIFAVENLQSVLRMVLDSANLSNQPQNNPKEASQPISLTNGNNTNVNDINTVELIQMVKEKLTKNSISQRSFGNYLGLSQGSISDILSRPKSWSQLTNKGKEPYLKMVNFLSDPNITELMLNSKTINVTDSADNEDDDDDEDDEDTELNVEEVNSKRNAMLDSQTNVYDGDDDDDGVETNNNKSIVTWTSDDNDDIGEDADDYNEQEYSNETEGNMVDLTQDQNDCLADSWHYDDSRDRILILANRITKVDTHSITTKVKEFLSFNNLGQRIFGERILNLSQGSVSELLSKPKQWDQLSLKGREPYVRMHLWLKLPDKLSSLNCTANTTNASTNNMTNSSSGSNTKLLHRQKSGLGISCNGDKENISSSTSSLKFENQVSADTQHHNESICTTSSNGLAQRKTRTVFTELQKAELQSVYSHCPYPQTEHLEELSRKFNVATRTISNWFHNKRMRTKQNLRVKSTGGDMKNVKFPLALSNSTTQQFNHSQHQLYQMPQDESLSQIYSSKSPDSTASSSSLRAPSLTAEEQISHSNNISVNIGNSSCQLKIPNSSININSTNTSGSNKRKRTNPIKLEMITPQPKQSTLAQTTNSNTITLTSKKESTSQQNSDNFNNTEDSHNTPLNSCDNDNNSSTDPANSLEESCDNVPPTDNSATNCTAHDLESMSTITIIDHLSQQPPVDI